MDSPKFFVFRRDFAILEPVMKKITQQVYRRTPDFIKIFYYLIFGRKRPWSGGYITFKLRCVRRALENKEMLQKFRSSSPLPRGYGINLDERVVEYPWVLSRIPVSHDQNLLDVGSALNNKMALNSEVLRAKKITIINLAPEEDRFRGISYVAGDARELPFDDNSFHFVTCISTLEHIGLDNRRYTKKAEGLESQPKDFEKAISELKRVAKPKAQVFITVPFGEYKNFDRFQQFNPSMVKKIVEIFNPSQYRVDYYKYGEEGWNISTEESSRHSKRRIFSGAVACLELIK